MRGRTAPRGSGALALLTLALSTVALAAGGLALHVVTASAEAAPENVVEVWVAAVPVNWNVVPNEHDAIEHEEFTPAETTFRTVVYRQYTKDFAKPIPNAPGNRGIQGPLIRARVGDTILVHFRNLDTAFNRPHSMHFHGVEYRIGLRRRVHPRLLGPRRQRQAGPGRSPTASSRGRTRRGSGPTTTTRPR